MPQADRHADGHAGLPCPPAADFGILSRIRPRLGPGLDRRPAVRSPARAAARAPSGRGCGARAPAGFPTAKARAAFDGMRTDAAKP